MVDIEKELLESSLKTRVKSKFGKKKGEELINCVKKCLSEGKTGEELKDCVKQCVLGIGESEETATEVSNLLLYSFIFVG